MGTTLLCSNKYLALLHLPSTFIYICICPELGENLTFHLQNFLGWKFGLDHCMTHGTKVLQEFRIHSIWGLLTYDLFRSAGSPHGCRGGPWPLVPSPGHGNQITAKLMPMSLDGSKGILNESYKGPENEDKFISFGTKSFTLGIKVLNVQMEPWHNIQGLPGVQTEKQRNCMSNPKVKNWVRGAGGELFINRAPPP